MCFAGTSQTIFYVNDPELYLVCHPDGKQPGFWGQRDDPDEVYVAFNIDPTQDIPQNFKGGVQGLNGAGKAGYIGPCPPSGTHHYHFVVYALDTRLDLSGRAGKAELEKAMQGHILAQGDLVGLYRKTK